jgi:hypothetical protein
MVSEKRIKTLRMLVGSHPLLVNSPLGGDVVRELQRVVDTKRIAGGDRWLLQVLHTTRALDTYLSQVVAQRGWTAKSPSLGSYLFVLKSQGVIVENQRSHWQKNLVDPRNKYMHTANKMPPQHLANDLLNEMDACMSAVLGVT